MFTIKRKINFFDCDPAGIIFYSRIFEFCHSAYEPVSYTHLTLADERSSVALGCRRIIKKKKQHSISATCSLHIK